MKNTMVLAAALCACTAIGAHAEVVDSSATGFTVKTTVTVRATPDEVYRKLVRNVGEWWNSRHTFSRNSRNLSIEEKAMGCFCERLPDGGGVRHMEVVNFTPGKTLVMTGALGPLQTLAAAANLAVALSPADGGTQVTVTYALTGYLKAGMNTWASPVDSMIAEQFTRLKNYIERGDPEPK